MPNPTTTTYPSDPEIRSSGDTQSKAQQPQYQSLESIMQRRLMTFLIQSIQNEVVIQFKNGQIATGILHSFDTDKFSFIVKNYYGYDEKKDYRKIALNDIDYFKVTASSNGRKASTLN